MIEFDGSEGRFVTLVPTGESPYEVSRPPCLLTRRSNLVHAVWRWTLRLSIGFAGGALLGLSAYQLPQELAYARTVDRQTVFVVCGAAIGITLSLIIGIAARSVRLSHVRIGVPRLGELQFVVTTDNRQLAWRFFVDSVTRVSIQVLQDDGGIVREALTSLYNLFTAVRATLKDAGPSRSWGNRPTVEYLAIAMINTELRPFLAKWHPRLLSWETANPGLPESDWPYMAECRAELVEMRNRLISFTSAFGRLALVPHATQILEGTFTW